MRELVRSATREVLRGLADPLVRGDLCEQVGADLSREIDDAVRFLRRRGSVRVVDDLGEYEAVFLPVEDRILVESSFVDRPRVDLVETIFEEVTHRILHRAGYAGERRHHVAIGRAVRYARARRERRSGRGR